MNFLRAAIALLCGFMFLKTDDLASQTCTNTCTSTSDGTWTSSGGTATWNCTGGSTPTTTNCIVLEHDIAVSQNQTVNLAATNLLMKAASANNGGLASTLLFENNSVVTMPAGAEIELETASILFPQGSNSNTFIQIGSALAWGKNSAYGLNPVNGPANITESGVVLLPVELIFFRAMRREQKIRLDWATASEVNHDYFEVEKSGDGSTWSAVALLENQGDGFSERNYEWLDESPFPGANYYRLRQVDLDGAFEYFKTAVVIFEQRPEDAILMFWRRDAAELEISLPQPVESAWAFNIWNAQGTEVYRTTLRSAGRTARLGLGKLPPGIYFANISGQGIFKTEKILIW